jgi:di/tricarboxylate transporter
MEPLIVMLLLLGVFSSETATDQGEARQPLAMEVPAAAGNPSEQGSEEPAAVGEDYRRRLACQVALHDVIYRDLSLIKKPPVTTENADTSDFEGGCGDE